MSDSIKLGGNIVLEGFEDLSLAEVTVAKKIIGGYARRFSDAKDSYKSLTISLSKTKDKYQLSATMSSDKLYEESSTNNNLFMALGEALNNLEKKVLG